MNARAFYFTVVFWGKEFRDYFITLLLASLLSPNNIPVLENKKDSRFVIATTEEDWNAIQNETLFLLLKSFIDVIYINLDISTDMSKMRLMSQGHKQISEVLFANKAIGVFVTPDLVLSDGAVVALQQRVSEGKKVVLCPAIRFEYQGCMRDFNQLGVMQPGKPMILPPRQLMTVALRNLHSETKTWLWDEPYYAHNPVCSMWRLPGGDNFVLHGYSWAPLAVDYASLQTHDTTTFDFSTLDQDYVYKNFGVSEDIYVVTDSDEMALVSFTDENDLHIPLVPHVSYQVPGLRNCINKDKLRRFHYSSLHGMDPLKRELVQETVLLHTTNIESSWDAIIRTANVNVASAIKKKPKAEGSAASIIYDLEYFFNFRVPALFRAILINRLLQYRAYFIQFGHYFLGRSTILNHIICLVVRKRAPDAKSQVEASSPSSEKVSRLRHFYLFAHRLDGGRIFLVIYCATYFFMKLILLRICSFFKVRPHQDVT